MCRQYLEMDVGGDYERIRIESYKNEELRTSESADGQVVMWYKLHSKGISIEMFTQNGN